MNKSIFVAIGSTVWLIAGIIMALTSAWRPLEIVLFSLYITAIIATLIDIATIPWGYTIWACLQWLLFAAVGFIIKNPEITVFTKKLLQYPDAQLAWSHTLTGVAIIILSIFSLLVVLLSFIPQAEVSLGELLTDKVTTTEKVGLTVWLVVTVGLLLTGGVQRLELIMLGLWLVAVFISYIDIFVVYRPLNWLAWFCWLLYAGLGTLIHYPASYPAWCAEFVGLSAADLQVHPSNVAIPMYILSVFSVIIIYASRRQEIKLFRSLKKVK